MDKQEDIPLWRNSRRRERWFYFSIKVKNAAVVPKTYVLVGVQKGRRLVRLKDIKGDVNLQEKMDEERGLCLLCQLIYFLGDVCGQVVKYSYARGKYKVWGRLVEWAIRGGQENDK